MWFWTRLDMNQALQARTMAKHWKSIEIVLSVSSKNKGADQLHSYCEADLRLFSHMQNVGFLMMQLHL